MMLVGEVVEMVFRMPSGEEITVYFPDLDAIAPGSVWMSVRARRLLGLESDPYVTDVPNWFNKEEV